MPDVGELVRDHEPDLIAAVAVEQRVEENHPLSRPEPGYIRVRRRRAATRVDRVHLPHLHPCRARQLDHVVAGLPRRQRCEAVEHRIEHDRPERREHGGDTERAPRHGSPPPARIAPRQRDDEPAARGGQGHPDRRLLEHVEDPPTPRLRDQADLERSAPGQHREREAGQGRGDRQAGGRGGGGRGSVAELSEAMRESRRPFDEGHERGQVERGAGEPERELPAGEARTPVDLLGCEVRSRLDLVRLDRPRLRREQARPGLGRGERDQQRREPARTSGVAHGRGL